MEPSFEGRSLLLSCSPVRSIKERGPSKNDSTFVIILFNFVFLSGEIMAKKGARETVKMKSSESDECYWTQKNKRNTTGRMELKKFDKKLKKHVMFKEAK